MEFLKLNNISKDYGKKGLQVCALKNISISVNKGDFIAIMGTSGSGKSTLLNILGCLDTQTKGEYFINGEETNKNDLAPLRNKMFGFVFQHFALIEDYTVEENIVVPLEYSKLSRKQKKQKVIKYLEILGLETKAKCFPKELSGGQSQRVAIARAIINDPEIILADEPTGALDSKTSENIINIFKKLNKAGKTIILVTHDKKIADQCNKIIFIEDGELRE
ncbi:ABC transporter ATP-binding protein (plasmid) [Clostridium gasigenes]|uniref:ABC transporter ATP-binding protein n=1 Tax=Clostridium gasigenes TaxID=94869 RepID=UPI0014382E8A|nr:ABC transporter ATP-binding protein [Clostridium gasigenes]NKF08828.1 ABC transporter ATP-binding protein [Clostridium gasigenes]QSW21545.1 ABC transporter ATP-binding protein [Clostridium gasigenes]